MLPALLILTRSADDLTLVARGDLDLTTKARFLEALAAVLAGPHPGDVPHADLTAVDFLDSAGLEALLWGHRQMQARGGQLYLRAKSTGQPGLVLRLSGFHRALRIDLVD